MQRVYLYYEFTHIVDKYWWIDYYDVTLSCWWWSIEVLASIFEHSIGVSTSTTNYHKESMGCPLRGSCFHLPHTLLSFSEGETHLRVEGIVFWLGQLIGLGDFWMAWGSKHFRTPKIQNKIMETSFSGNLTKFIINFEWHNHIKNHIGQQGSKQVE